MRYGKAHARKALCRALQAQWVAVAQIFPRQHTEGKGANQAVLLAVSVNEEMKKVTSLLLALLLTASLGACAAKDPAPSTPAPSASAFGAAPAGEQPTDGKKVDKMVIVLPNVRG